MLARWSERVERWDNGKEETDGGIKQSNWAESFGNGGNRRQDRKWETETKKKLEVREVLGNV